MATRQQCLLGVRYSGADVMRNRLLWHRLDINSGTHVSFGDFQTKNSPCAAYVSASNIEVSKDSDKIIMQPKNQTPYNFIKTYQVDHAVCDHICKFFEDHEHMAQPGRLGEAPRVDKAMKDSTDLSVPIQFYGQVDPFFELLGGFVKDYLDRYYYSSGANGLGPLGFSEWANIQHYPVGGGYPAIHCERDRIEYCRRALVWMLYLTDTPGGGTEFPHQGVTTECVKGNVIIWPSDMTHMHRGIVSQSHEKMIFTGWIDFITPERSQKTPG